MRVSEFTRVFSSLVYKAQTEKLYRGDSIKVLSNEVRL